MDAWSGVCFGCVDCDEIVGRFPETEDDLSWKQPLISAAFRFLSGHRGFQACVRMADEPRVWVCGRSWNTVVFHRIPKKCQKGTYSV